MSAPDESRLPPPYMKAHQARRREPTAYENLLADAIEAAFGAGAWDLEALVARLNEDGVRTPEGGLWNTGNFEAVIRRLEGDL